MPLYEQHGLSRTSEYRSWAQMKARCYNKNHHAYERYGGRGIKVCARWLDSATNFMKDMGIKPSRLHSLDRINPNGNYEPDNCRWADQNEQAMTRRKSNPIAGVFFEKDKKFWRASLSVKGVRVLHKRCKTYEEAVALRAAAEKKYLGKQLIFIL